MTTQSLSSSYMASTGKPWLWASTIGRMPVWDFWGSHENADSSRAWSHTLVLAGLERFRRDNHESEVNLGYKKTQFMILTYSLRDADVTWLGAFFWVAKFQDTRATHIHSRHTTTSKVRKASQGTGRDGLSPSFCHNGADHQRDTKPCNPREAGLDTQPPPPLGWEGQI